MLQPTDWSSSRLDLLYLETLHSWDNVALLIFVTMTHFIVATQFAFYDQGVDCYWGIPKPYGSMIFNAFAINRKGSHFIQVDRLWWCTIVIYFRICLTEYIRFILVYWYPVLLLSGKIGFTSATDVCCLGDFNFISLLKVSNASSAAKTLLLEPLKPEKCQFFAVDFCQTWPYNWALLLISLQRIKITLQTRCQTCQCKSVKPWGSKMRHDETFWIIYVIPCYDKIDMFRINCFIFLKHVSRVMDIFDMKRLTIEGQHPPT